MISGHYSNDDPRHFFFVRDSRLPLGTFPRRHYNPERWVFAACVVLVLALIALTGVL